jgi:Mce-associated membrane protein
MTEDADDAKVKLSKAERLEAKAAKLREAESNRAGERGPAPRGLMIATVVLGVVTAALVALLVIGFLSWQHQRDMNDARSSALKAAKTFAVDFGSYDYRHLDTDFTEVATRMTPSFAKSYTETSDRLKPTFTQYKTQVVARLQGFGVTSVSTSKATIVVFLDQTVRTSQSSTPRVDRNRLELHLVHQKGKWLVAKLLAK